MLKDRFEPHQTHARASEAHAGMHQQSRTELGKRLREIRSRLRESGVALLGWDEIERELQERHGQAEE